MKIYLSEEQVERLSKPFTINPSLFKNEKDLLSNSKFLPSNSIFDVKTKILKNRFNELKSAIKGFSSFKGFTNVEGIKNELNALTTKCAKIEEKHKKALQDLVIDVVNDLFKIPEGTVLLNAELLPLIKPSRKIRIRPEYGEHFEYETISAIEDISKEIEKRILVNSLIEGGAFELFSKSDELISKLHRIEPELPILYQKILYLHEILLFLEDIEYTEDNFDVNGFVEVIFGNDVNKTQINSYGKLFPFLFIETVKGLLQLFASHGLPDDKKIAMFVLKQTEFLNAESWYKRYGVNLWKLLFANNKIDTELIPHYMMNFSMLGYDDMLERLPEIFSGARIGEDFRKELIDNAKRSFDYDKFEDEIILRNQNEGELNFTEDELSNFQF